jgi:hypothetical protein
LYGRFKWNKPFKANSTAKGQRKINRVRASTTSATKAALAAFVPVEEPPGSKLFRTILKNS